MSHKQEKFSVLLSIYHKEKARYFDECMTSIWDTQTLKPNEIVLILDGQLTNKLYEILKKWEKKLEKVLKVIRLEKNKGLAKALNVGLKACSYKLIARMDTDDIATPQRFEKQLKFLQTHHDVDVLGTFISEISETGKEINKIIPYPLEHKELFQFFKKRDPLAHPTVVFRKRFFEKAGVYPTDLQYAEDTLLWHQGFMTNCKFANINYIGLKYRRTSDFYTRRADHKKSIGLLKQRLFKINNDLDYGLIGNLYAIAYYCLSLSPPYIKAHLYDRLRTSSLN